MSRQYHLELTVNPKQARLIADALDLYSRIGMGQLECVAEALGDMGLGNVSGPYNPLREIMMGAKESVLHMPRNGSHGIAHPEVSNDAKTAYDTCKAVQKGIATAESHSSISVWHHGDMLHLGTEPTPQVVLIRDDERQEIPVNQHHRDECRED